MGKGVVEKSATPDSKNNMAFTIGEILMEESKTGTYRFNKLTGRTEKISGRIPVLKAIPDWARQMDSTGEVRRANDAIGDRKMKEIYSKQ